MMISHLREFGNTSVHFCGEGKGESCEIQIMLETGISWLSEIVSCQDVTWILNITSHHINPVSEASRRCKKNEFTLFPSHINIVNTVDLEQQLRLF